MSMSWSRELVAADREELDESDRETLKSARGGVELDVNCRLLLGARQDQRGGRGGEGGTARSATSWRR
ncbi:MAG: hypothetical protein F4152_02195 [Dehalococcoidia bacterium]|nr:hypothetical protein [Dehalococcoidia bacterium]